MPFHPFFVFQDSIPDLRNTALQEVQCREFCLDILNLNKTVYKTFKSTFHHEKKLFQSCQSQTIILLPEASVHSLVSSSSPIWPLYGCLQLLFTWETKLNSSNCRWEKMRQQAASFLKVPEQFTFTNFRVFLGTSHIGDPLAKPELIGGTIYSICFSLGTSLDPRRMSFRLLL